MPNKQSQLLSPTELLDIYGVPYLNDSERSEYFTFNEKEFAALKCFNNTENAAYFAVCLVFFKIKKTLVNFNFKDVAQEYRYIMGRYFPREAMPKSLPKNRDTNARIENKVLDLCNHKRFTKKIADQLQSELLLLAPSHPRQRQLCKAFLDLLTKHRVSIPGATTVQDVVSNIWNAENKRIVKLYSRYTNKAQKEKILFLLKKTDKHHNIISIKQEMKGFNTTELWSEIEKLDELRHIFEIANNLLPKLRLPTATVNYYAGLINYYGGSRLKQINPQLAQVYLLCYSYLRYQKLNDNLLEALKKRTLDYNHDADEHAKEESLKQLDQSKEIRKRISRLLLTIKNYPDPNFVPKPSLYEHVPENELIIAAKMLVDEGFDKRFSFWKYIDSVEDSIKINLRKIFLALDLVVTNNDPLNSVVLYVKAGLSDGSFHTNPLPQYVHSWIKESDREYLFDQGNIIHNRFEFFLYKQIVHHISTNKLTLKHTIKHKKLMDDLMSTQAWKKDKKKILKKLDYPKLQTSIQKNLRAKSNDLTELYHKVNDDIISGKNKDIKIITDKDGDKQWRLRPLEAASDPNESVLAAFQQRSIVDVINFVSSKTGFIRGFEPILPKSKKGQQDIPLIMAAVLANAIRIGSRKIADISDLNESALTTAEAAYIRTETLVEATDIVNNAAAKLPIFKKWYIDSILHGSIDGLKLETSLRNAFARHSKKYFGRGTGVSAYNEIVNSFSVAGQLIGSNDYEGNFSFEMVHHQNTSDIKPTCVSVDMHGTNAVNFALFELTDILYTSRIPKPHNEILWGFDKIKNSENYIIKPARFANDNLIIDEWDNIQHFIVSLLTGDANPSHAIRKLSSRDYNSNTKKALVQYNSIIKTQFLLMYLHDAEFRRAITIALNRGEAYNNLYRAITVHNKGALRGVSEIEMEIWHQCTRLISSIMLYYNSYILNKLYLNAKCKSEKELLMAVSPCAWSHINLLGYYQFYGHFNDLVIDRLISEWNWKNQKLSAVL